MLKLYEELFLLALDEEKGNIFSFARQPLAYALPGAILAELALEGKLAINEKRRLLLVDEALTGDPLLDRVLEAIQTSEKARKLTSWVSRLSEEPKKMRQRVGERLAEKNVLIQEEKRFFRRPFEAGSDLPAVPEKFHMKYPLRAMILDEADCDPPSVATSSLALLSILAAAGLLGLVFTQDELGPAERQLHKQVLEAAMDNNVLQLIEEIEQAVCSTREDEAE